GARPRLASARRPGPCRREDAGDGPEPVVSRDAGAPRPRLRGRRLRMADRRGCRKLGVRVVAQGRRTAVGRRRDESHARTAGPLRTAAAARRQLARAPQYRCGRLWRQWPRQLRRARGERTSIAWPTRIGCRIAAADGDVVFRIREWLNEDVKNEV